MSGIRSYGAYLPRLRLERSTIVAATSWLSAPAKKPVLGARAVCNWDEDSVTMGVAAAQDCLARSAGAESLSRIELASTTLPFADRSNAGLLAAALAREGPIAVGEVTGSLRCATSALIRALQSNETTLVVAAERRQARPGSAQELELGHGAAAVLVDPRDGGIVYLGGASLARDFVDHHRSDEASVDYVLEERWVRDEAYFKLIPQTIRQALAAASTEPGAVTHLICPTSAAIGRRIAADSGLRPESLTPNPALRFGDLGCAHALFSLALTLDGAKAGDTLVVVGFGQGVDVLVLRVAQEPEHPGRLSALFDKSIAENSYLRYLSHSGLVDVDFGMRAERDHRSAQSVAYRRRDAITAFIGGKCGDCGTVQFPRSRVCVNPACRRTDTQAAHRLADSSGRVKTFTEDWQAYSPRPPYIYGNVSFAEGGNLFMEFCDLEPGELQVDMPVKFLFRIKDIDRVRNFKRYFWKAAPT